MLDDRTAYSHYVINFLFENMSHFLYSFCRHGCFWYAICH